MTASSSSSSTTSVSSGGGGGLSGDHHHQVTSSLNSPSSLDGGGGGGSAGAGSVTPDGLTANLPTANSTGAQWLKIRATEILTDSICLKHSRLTAQPITRQERGLKYFKEYRSWKSIAIIVTA